MHTVCYLNGLGIAYGTVWLVSVLFKEKLILSVLPDESLDGCPCHGGFMDREGLPIHFDLEVGLMRRVSRASMLTCHAILTTFARSRVGLGLHEASSGQPRSISP